MIRDLTKEYHRRRILRDIKKAKKYFQEGKTEFMCHSFMMIDTKYCNNPVSSIIPEFNVDFLNAQYKDRMVWWDILDRESRIKAFDKLIEAYNKK